MADENVERPGAVPEGARADKPPRKVQRQPPTIKPKPKEEKAKGSGLERAKAWSDSVLSVVKTVTLLAVTGMIVWLATKVIWHDRGQRQISFEIDQKVEKLISDLGVDFDLRAGVRDETNSRIRGVQSFLQAGLFKNIDVGGSQPISFKPFGVEMTTTEVTRIARLLLGSGEPAFRVRFELLCDPAPCDSAQPTSQKIADRFTRLTLIVIVSGPEGHERLRFPLSTKAAALRRGLRAAMERTAEKLLEFAEPLIASVLYLNAATTLQFADEQRRYQALAAGATFLVRREIGKERFDRTCLSEIVLGDSLLQRGDYDGGIAKLEDIATDARKQVDGIGAVFSRENFRSCLIQAKTDQIVFLLNRVCVDQNNRETLLNDAVKDMNELRLITKNAPELEKTRVEEFFAFSAFLAALFADDAEALASACKEANERSQLPKGYPRSDRAIKALDGFRQHLQPGRWLKEPGTILNLLLDYAEVAIPREDPADRLTVLFAALAISDKYVTANANPGALYLSIGRIFRGIAEASYDARWANDAEKRKFVLICYIRAGGDAAKLREIVDKMSRRDLDAAIQTELRWSLAQSKIAFENASAVVNPFPWLRTSSNMDALISLGDMYLVDGSVDQAEKYYASALSLFLDKDAPLQDFQRVARTAGRWATIRHSGGACQRSAKWDTVWRSLGAVPDRDWCQVAASHQAASMNVLGVLEIVGAYARNVVAECASSEYADFEMPKPFAKLDLIRCFERSDISSSRKFLSGESGIDIDRKINEALEAR